MALLEKQLVVKRSTIPNSGKGLFTKKLIPKGTLIVEYKGKKTTWKDVDIDEGRNGYIYYINRKNVIDARTTPQHLARYANDAQGMTRVKGITNNCRYLAEMDTMRVYIEAVKDIPAGGEIFVQYGKEYWDVIKHNKKIDEREKAKAEKEKLKKASSTKKAAKKKSTAKKKASKKKK
ncbi:MAG TPA: SET domain-containing protein [Flavisolibacter sp.]|nr:SET domain-containing protein [Flavisolibacter sp.]